MHTIARVTRLAVPALVVAAAACSKDDAAAPSPVARLVIGDVPDTLGLGDTLSLGAIALDAQGQPVERAVVTWSSRAPQRVDVTSAGRLRALAVGDAWLVARATVDGRVAARDSVRTVAMRLPRGVVLVAPRDSVGIGDTLTVRATVVDGLGAAMPGHVARFRSSDSLGVTVDSVSGFARVLADGDTRIVADAGPGAAASVVLRAWLPRVATGGVRLTQVDLGWNFGCGLDEAGAAYCWGVNGSGQLGRGPRGITDVEPFAPVLASGRYTAIGAGRGTACAIRTDGGADCWGRTVSGWLPPGGDFRTPVRVPLPDSASALRSVHMGDNEGHCLLDTGGWSFCWGRNTYGAIGALDSVGQLVATPRPIPGTPGSFRSIHPGDNHGCGVRFAAGAVYCWGNNYTLDAIPPGERGLPHVVSGVPPLRDVAVGMFASCGRAIDGAAWCWGFDSTGTVQAPTRLRGPAFAQLEASTYNACGLTADGAMYCWALSYATMGAVVRSAEPRPFSRRLRFVDIAVGPHAACGLTASGDVYCLEGTPRFGFN